MRLRWPTSTPSGSGGDRVGRQVFFCALHADATVPSVSEGADESTEGGTTPADAVEAKPTAEPEWPEHIRRNRSCPPRTASPTSGPVYRKYSGPQDDLSFL